MSKKLIGKKWYAETLQLLTLSFFLIISASCTSMAHAAETTYSLVQARLVKDRAEKSDEHQGGNDTYVTQCSQASVCIFSTVDGQNIQVSGVAISPNGLILTTAHDLFSKNRIVVQLHDGTVGEGYIFVIDRKFDLALLVTDIHTPDYACISSARETGFLPIGTRLRASGCPFGLANTWAEGTITAPPRLMEEMLMFQSNLPVYPGSSGMPVFDSRCRLIALVKGRIKGKSKISFLIPSFYAGSLYVKARHHPEEQNASLNGHHPQGADYWLIMALASVDFRSEEQALLKALKIDPDFTAAIYHLGLLYSSYPDKIIQEEKIWNRLVSLQPGWGEGHFRLANCLLRLDKLQQAEKSYNLAVKYLVDDPRAYNNLGEALRREKQFSAAQNAFKQALSLNPDYSLAHFNLGILYDRDLSSPEQAIFHYKKYLKLRPQATDAPEVRQWLQKLERGLY